MNGLNLKQIKVLENLNFDFIENIRALFIKVHISTECDRLFEDVDDEYCQISLISKKFEEWSIEQSVSYNEAYIALCLPKLYTPFVRLALVTWNPLESDQMLLNMKWFKDLASYNLRRKLSEDEIKIIPTIVEKMIVPKITGYIEQVWDPLSSNQTNRLQKLIRNLFYTFPTLNTSSKHSQVCKIFHLTKFVKKRFTHVII